MHDQPQASEVLLFWFGGPAERGRRQKRWFEKSEAFDRQIGDRFAAAYEFAAAGNLSH
jgi:uncharacterized protein (DUF924 family)